MPGYLYPQDLVQSRPHFMRRLLSPVLSFLAFVLFRVRAQGLESIPQHGPLILYFNHIHWAEPALLVQLLFGRRFAVPFVKAETVDYPVVGALLRWFGVIFLERREVDIAALQAGLDVLKAGHVLVIAPEGTRSRLNQGLQPARRGLGLMVRHTNAALQPVAVWGADGFPNDYKWWQRPHVYLQFGQPFHMIVPDDVSRRQAESEITDYAMQELAALLPEAMRGVYAPLAQRHPWAVPVSQG